MKIPNKFLISFLLISLLLGLINPVLMLIPISAIIILVSFIVWISFILMSKEHSINRKIYLSNINKK